MLKESQYPRPWQKLKFGAFQVEKKYHANYLKKKKNTPLFQVNIIPIIYLVRGNAYNPSATRLKCWKCEESIIQ